MYGLNDVCRGIREYDAEAMYKLSIKTKRERLELFPYPPLFVEPSLRIERFGVGEEGWVMSDRPGVAYQGCALGDNVIFPQNWCRSME